MNSSSRLFHNATSETHSCFDKETYAGESYFTSWSPKTLGIHQQLHFLEATSTASRWTKGGVKFLAPSVPRNFSGLSHPLPACTATILMLLVSSGLFDGFDWEMTNLHNISACEAGSVDMQEALTTGAAPSGAANKKSPAGAASKMAKKAWTA
ncbi:hypothetical protein Bca4012_094500 [Brassica carinata]